MMQLWSKINNVAFIVVLAAFVVFGVISGVRMLQMFGWTEFFNQVGMLMLAMFAMAAIYEAVRLVRNKGVKDNWWISFSTALAVPLFIVGTLEASRIPWMVLAPVLVIASLLMQKAVASRATRRGVDGPNKKR